MTASKYPGPAKGLDAVEREFDYMIWKESSLGREAKVKELRKRLEEYQILYKNGGRK